MRKLIHLDMDAFYASVEQRDRPELRGRPVIVGGRPERRGVVAAASYEARPYGVGSAMPSALAQRRCPHAVFIPSDMARYREVSRQVFAILADVTDVIEPLSLDEAYLDVTDNHLGEPLAGRVAKHLEARIRRELHLTSSAGVAPAKFVAKVASDLDKPDGLVIVPPDRLSDFVAELPVHKLPGVGPVTARKLEELGIRLAGDLRRWEPAELVRRFGQHGRWLLRLAHGDDPRPVNPVRTPKSRSAETTFAEDVRDLDTLAAALGELAEQVERALARLDRRGRTVLLKVRYADFTTVTRRRTLDAPTADAARIAEVGTELLHTTTEAGTRPVRLVGVGVGDLRGADEPTQLALPLGATDATHVF